MEAGRWKFLSYRKLGAENPLSPLVIFWFRRGSEAAAPKPKNSLNMPFNQG
ncbi:hypothetical protein [Chryseobacterium sp. FH2]|uniref:hypothetical protein n=1 Tax=Chryseobacterium sp. FH2 TaxID=1674291 RepID=UPI000B2CA8C7|nr:hypothetical protein [Chryseobacterium sp. FH2]